MIFCSSLKKKKAFPTQHGCRELKHQTISFVLLLLLLLFIRWIRYAPGWCWPAQLLQGCPRKSENECRWSHVCMHDTYLSVHPSGGPIKKCFHSRSGSWLDCCLCGVLACLLVSWCKDVRSYLFGMLP